MEVIEIDGNFKDEVTRYNGKVLADFNANWCGPCRMLKPILDEVAKESNVKIVSINIDNDESLAEDYNISSIPCLILFDNGKEVKRHVGLMSKDGIKEMIGEE